MYIDGSEYGEYKTYFEAERALARFTDSYDCAEIYNTYYLASSKLKYKSELLYRKINRSPKLASKDERRDHSGREDKIIKNGRTVVFHVLGSEKMWRAEIDIENYPSQKPFLGHKQGDRIDFKSERGNSSFIIDKVL